MEKYKNEGIKRNDINNSDELYVLADYVSPVCFDKGYLSLSGSKRKKSGGGFFSYFRGKGRTNRDKK